MKVDKRCRRLYGYTNRKICMYGLCLEGFLPKII